MDAQIAAALDAGFPDRAVARVTDAGPSWNEANRTVGVEFEDGERIYLKTASDGDGSRVARERAVIDYVAAHTPVPVPDIVAADASAVVPYLATAPVDGPGMLELWSDADKAGKETLARDVGQALARLHTARFDAPGHVLGGGTDGLDLDIAPWTEVLVDTVELMRELAYSDRFDHHFDRVIEAVRANRDCLDDTPAALLHGDPAQPNCFVVDDRTGFLDWEVAHVGDPARDLYRARDQQFTPVRGDASKPLVDALYEGYRRVAGGLPDGYDERAPIYDAVRLLGVSGHFGQTVEFYDEDPAEFADWLEAEMDRRLARVS
ncbi:phosphotransferase family protein [Halorarius litoreus]|uniref:phosphotransferase family protein n=1 Tax=Halorarius litoreus TaxID=2962676 RepID=UPI0020CCEA68|nr:phosphotransferase [Halorarius litoreus]